MQAFCFIDGCLQSILRLQFVEHCSSTKDFWICRFVDKNCVDKNSTKRHFFLTVQSKSLQNHFIFFGQDDLSDDDTDEEEPSESESVDMNATILQSSTSVEKILAKIRKAVRAILNILCSLFVRFCRQKTSFFSFFDKNKFSRNLEGLIVIRAFPSHHVVPSLTSKSIP